LAGWLDSAVGDWQGQGEQREEKIEQIDDSWNRISLTTRWNGLFSKQIQKRTLQRIVREIDSKSGRGRASRERRRRRSQGWMDRGGGWPGGEGGRWLLDRQNWLAGWLDSGQMEIGWGRESRKRRRRRSQGRMARGGWPGGEGGRIAAGSAELAGWLAGLGRWRVPAFFIHG
jgi:hypothetical protein